MEIVGTAHCLFARQAAGERRSCVDHRDEPLCRPVSSVRANSKSNRCGGLCSPVTADDITESPYPQSLHAEAQTHHRTALTAKVLTPHESCFAARRSSPGGLDRIRPLPASERERLPCIAGWKAGHDRRKASHPCPSFHSTDAHPLVGLASAAGSRMPATIRASQPPTCRR